MNNTEVLWRNAYNQCSTKLLAMCTRYVRNRQLAEDLMHEGFLTAIDKYQTFSGKGSFEGWLRKVIINTVLQHLRSQRNLYFINLEDTRDFEDAEKDQESSETNVRSVIEQAGFNQEDLLLILNEIPDHYRVVFNLYVLDGYQHSQIASMLNIAVGTSKSNLARARKKITELLFQKATKKKDRKKASVVIILIPMLFIDGLFKQVFAEHAVSPKKMPEALQTRMKKLNSRNNFYKVTSNKFALLSISGTVTVGCIITWLVFQNKLDNRGDEKVFVIDTIQSEVVQKPSIPVVDTIPVQKKNTQPLQRPKKVNATVDTTTQINRVPILINKQIILHDTIVVTKKKDE